MPALPVQSRRFATAVAFGVFPLALIFSCPSFASDYSPMWSGVCALGTNIKEGCAAVRARTVLDSSVYPWSAIGRVNVAGIKSRSHCTGALIGERLVLTAAHCAYDQRRKNWVRASRIHFLAGFQRGKHVGHSFAVRYVVSQTHDVTSREYRHRPRDDWAILELRDAVGLSAGYLGWAVFERADLDRAMRPGVQVMLAGYPAIRPYVLSADMGCKELQIRADADLIFHRCAVMKGDSGAPLLLFGEGNASVVGVLSGRVAGSNEFSSVSVPAASFHEAILKIAGESAKATEGLTKILGKPPMSTRTLGSPNR